MAEVNLPVITGRPTGSRPANRLRNEGKIPGVVYGLGSEPVPVAVAWSDLRAALTTEAGLNALLDLQMDGDTKLAIVKDIQRHPVRHTVHHVDFSLIDRQTELNVEVPVLAEGEALEVTREGGIVDQTLFSLLIWARPEHIPNELTVDISELELGDSIRVADIDLPAGVTTDMDPEEPVVVTAIPAATIAEDEEDEEAEEGEEGEPGEAGEAAEAGEGDDQEG